MATECPYSSGTILELHQGDEKFRAQIIQVLNEDVEEPLDSCTVRILDIRDCQERFLKIMDWRYADYQRDEFDCGLWDKSKARSYEAFPLQRMLDFQQLLQKSMSSTDSSHPLIQEWQKPDALPSNPIYMDLYYWFLDRCGTGISPLIEAGLIRKRPKKAHREIYLRQYHRFQAAFESHVAQIVSAKLPGCMPKALGVWDVRVLDDRQPETKLPYYQVWGLLMERVDGQQLSTLNPLIFTPERLTKLMLEVTCFNLRLWRYGLTLSKYKLRDCIVRLGPGSDMSLAHVNFGAITVISNDPLTLRAVTPGDVVQFPKYYSFSFLSDCTEDVPLDIVRKFHPRDESLKDFMIKITIDDIDEYYGAIHRFMWQTVLLHLLFAFHEKEIRENTYYVLSMLIQARNIMREEINRNLDVDESWWERATEKIAQAVGTDYEATKACVKEIVAGYKASTQNRQHLWAFDEVHKT